MKINIANFSRCINRQLKYHNHGIRNEIGGVLLEIVLNDFKCLTVLPFFKILLLHRLCLFTVSTFSEFAMLLDLYILLPPQEEEVHSSSWVDRCTLPAAHWSKRLIPLSAITLWLVRLYFQKRTLQVGLFVIGPASVDFW